MHLLPLGSIIEVDHYRQCVIGYATVDREQDTVTGYLTVSYPLGFTSVEKTVFIPQNMSFNLISKGYSTAVSHKLLETLSKGIKILETASYDEIVKLNQVLKKLNTGEKEGGAE